MKQIESAGQHPDVHREIELMVGGAVRADDTKKVNTAAVAQRLLVLITEAMPRLVSDAASEFDDLMSGEYDDK